jgi:hypothetical protein
MPATPAWTPATTWDASNSIDAFNNRGRQQSRDAGNSKWLSNRVAVMPTTKGTPTTAWKTEGVGMSSTASSFIIHFLNIYPFQNILNIRRRKYS